MEKESDNSVAWLGEGLEELIDDMGHPAEWEYLVDKGNDIKCADGRLSLEAYKDDDDPSFFQEELANWKEHDEHLTSMLWFARQCWEKRFDDPSLKKFVQAKDPVNGLINFAELRNLLLTQLKEYCQYRVNDPHHLTVQIQIQRHDRLLILASWLCILGEPDDSLIRCNRIYSVEQLNLETESVANPRSSKMRENDPPLMPSIDSFTISKVEFNLLLFGIKIDSIRKHKEIGEANLPHKPWKSGGAKRYRYLECRKKIVDHYPEQATYLPLTMEEITKRLTAFPIS